MAITVWPAELEANDVLSGVDTERLSLSVADACSGTKEEEDDDSTSDEDCEVASVELDGVELLRSVARDGAVKLVALSLAMGLATDSYVVLLGVV